MPPGAAAQLRKRSPPAREAWIEILLPARPFARVPPSPPAREAWIEISRFQNCYADDPSPPAREAWIEMTSGRRRTGAIAVASREGGVD